MLETCLMLRRRLGNSVEIAATLSTLSLARLQTDDAAGATESELEALQMFRDLRDRRGEAIGLLHLGQISAFLGDGAQACSYFEQCLAIAREIKFQELEGACELLLGEVAFDNDDWTQAVLWIKRSLTICREAADKRGEASALYWLGKCDLRRGDITTARARLGDALRAFRSFEMWTNLSGGGLAELASLEGTQIAVRLSPRPTGAGPTSARRSHEQRWRSHRQVAAGDQRPCV
jgi:tetratricopeptide (TPR) repeat protein